MTSRETLLAAFSYAPGISSGETLVQEVGIVNPESRDELLGGTVVTLGGLDQEYSTDWAMFTSSLKEKSSQGSHD